MSRLRNYLSAVTSGYFSLAANTIYTLASIPIALHYLSTDEFGIWVLVAQLAGYMQFLDFGMANSVPRIIIDVKDDRDGEAYAGVIRTSQWINWVQAAVVLVAGSAASWGCVGLLRVPPLQAGLFLKLAVAQFAVFAAGYAMRVYTQILTAHQRLDAVNVLQCVFFTASLGLMWLGFALGFGLFALPLASMGATLLSQGGSVLLCRAWGLLPRRAAGAIAWPALAELLRLGGGTFLVVLGSQLITSFQPFLVARYLGLTAAATWSVCTKLFAFAGQIVWRFFDSSVPALGEMMARGEHDRLRHRVAGLATASALLGAVAAVAFALVNQPFIRVWTHAKIGWAPANDYLLAVWLVVLGLFHGPGMLILTSKRLQSQGLVYIAEGLVSLSAGVLLLPRFGIAAMIASGIACNLCFHGPYVLARVHRYLGLPLREVAVRWSLPAILAAAVGLPLALGADRLLGGWAPWPQLVGKAVLAAALGAALLAAVLPAAIRAEIVARLPGLRRRQAEA